MLIQVMLLAILDDSVAFFAVHIHLRVNIEAVISRVNILGLKLLKSF